MTTLPTTLRPLPFPLESKGIAIRYIGQVGFVLQHRGFTIAIDPYLTDSVDRLKEFPKDFWVRNYDPPVCYEELHYVDLVLCTHDHLDHLDPETLLGISTASPQCRFLMPKQSAEIMRANGLATERIDVINAGQNLSFGDITIEPVAAAHESYETDDAGFHRFLSYLLTWKGMTIYHAGDTLRTPELEDIFSHRSIDVAFLPINGRSESRRKLGIVGNLTPEEAVNLAASTNIGLVIPTHYDLYPNNGAKLADFVSAWELVPQEKRPALKAFLPGEVITYSKPNAAKELAVIIGAGKTGRGFLARLLQNSSYAVAFIDKSEPLVKRLNEDGRYVIHYFGGEHSPNGIEHVIAAHSNSQEAHDWLCQASLVMTAIGESNIPELGSLLIKALEYRRSHKTPKMHMLVCENGVTPAAPLEQLLTGYDDVIELGEAAIFCSTIELPGTRLDIQSEYYHELPFDSQKLNTLRHFPGLRPEAEFPILLIRKIYTYNCLSACIAYLGAYKNYQWYADAANDPEISEILDQIAEPLNKAISKTYNVDIDKQRLFSQAALKKFRDYNIRDSIARNARNAIGKLSPNDRLAGPARLISEQGDSVTSLALVIASVLLYAEEHEPSAKALLNDPVTEHTIETLTGHKHDSELARASASFYHRLKKSHHQSLSDVLALSKCSQ